jgi:hypothetical protein|tara:strand:+ start:2688 stop:3176 length:489 start_codon:yes stop_codon:yes gene_type:complete
MATLQERINMLAGEMESPRPQLSSEMQLSKDMSDNTIEQNIAAIQQQMDDAVKMPPERQQFIQARQELIDEVLMPLSDSGYSDIVNIILTKPKDSPEHDQASIALAEIMAQVDEEFNPEEFDMMINMVSKEPRPADLINPEGLPDSPPTPPRPMPMGIEGLK